MNLTSKKFVVTRVKRKSKARYAMAVGDVFSLETQIVRSTISKGNRVVFLDLTVNGEYKALISMNEASTLVNSMIEYEVVK